MASAVRKRILTISRDRPLQRTRTLILEEAGYTVFEVSTHSGALSLISAIEGIDLVVICHSVPEGARESLAEAIKKEYPAVPILMLCRDWDAKPPLVDAFINVCEATPASWLSMVGLMSSSAQG